MAARGSKKRLSVDHEDFIARVYGGVRSPSSGGAGNDCGDVRTKNSLFECKATTKSQSKILKEFEKVTKEAYSEGREPRLALRYFAPESILANLDGWVDLIVRTVENDQLREQEFEYLQASEGCL
jgi:Holliday junction resolvase